MLNLHKSTVAEKQHRLNAEIRGLHSDRVIFYVSALRRGARGHSKGRKNSDKIGDGEVAEVRDENRGHVTGKVGAILRD